MVIHGDKLRWLFWLRWKMLLRGFTRDVGRVIGTIMLVIFGLPVIGGIAVATYFGYRYLPAPANTELLFLVLTGIGIAWVVLPLFQFNVNEGLDLSKLTLFPLTRAEVMASLVISSFLDVSTIGLLLIFIAVVAGWAFSLPLALFAALAMIIFYIQVIGMSQLVLALLMRTLQSRRFRDLSIILIAVFSSSCYLIQQLVLRSVGTAGFVNNLQEGTFSHYLQWFPPGMIARAIQQAFIGNWGLGLLWLTVGLVLSIVVLYCWQLVVANALSTPETGGNVGRRRRAQSGVQSTSTPVQTGVLARIRSSQTYAIVVKDLKYYRRDPQLQAIIVQSVISIAVLSFVTVFNSGRGSAGAYIGSWRVLLTPLFVYLSLYTLSYNILGFERQGLTALFLFPIDPKSVLWGKNIVVAVLGGVELLVLVLLSSFLAQSWEYTGIALIGGLAGLGIILGCGNFTSVFFPQRMRQMQRGFQSGNANSSGCLRVVMSMATLLAMAVILVPVAMALFLPLILNATWAWSLAMPASLIYGAAFYYVVTALVAPRMLTRTPEILAITTRE